MITLEMADDYFAHSFFGKQAWKEVEADSKQVLLDTAQEDILVYLKTRNVDSSALSTKYPYSPIQCAMFEWALFLATNSDKVQKRIEDGALNVTAVKVDGIGSENYAKRNTYSDTYSEIIESSPAKRYLSMIYEDIRILR